MAKRSLARRTVHDKPLDGVACISVIKDGRVVYKARPEYHAWQKMKERCLNPEHRAYKNYGRRGIKVDPRWLGPDGFKNFITDVGYRPGPGWSLDREDNDGDYTRGNCRWATRSMQMTNTRRTRMITALGKTMALADWVRETGLNYKTITSRIDRWGMVDRVMTSPVNR
jgi:hypothetical protein